MMSKSCLLRRWMTSVNLESVTLTVGKGQHLFYINIITCKGQSSFFFFSLVI